MFKNRFFALRPVRSAFPALFCMLAIGGLGGSSLVAQPSLEPPAPVGNPPTPASVIPPGAGAAPPAVAPGAVVPGALAPGAGPATAATEWLEDYKKALEESQAVGKPLLILFVGSECPWCQKLAGETLAEPNIKSRLKSQWVCVKIDAMAQRPLAASLNIRNVPTMILARPKATLLARQEGFLNPQALAVQLDRARYQWQAESEQVAHLFRDAIGKIRQGDLVTANGQLTRVLENPVDTTMRQEAAYLVELLKRGEPNAILRNPDQPFQDILTKYGIAQGEAPGSLASRAVEKNPNLILGAGPSDLLQLAREDLAKKQIAAALEKLEWLGQQKPDSADAVQAQKLLKDLRNNTESLRCAVDQMQEKLTQALLQLAESNLAAGDPQQAIACLEQVVRVNPGSRNADIAQSRLAQLQGQPQPQALQGLQGRSSGR